MSFFRQVSPDIRDIEVIEIHKGPLGLIVTGKGKRAVRSESITVSKVIMEYGVRSEAEIRRGKMLIICTPGAGYNILNVVQTELGDGISAAIIQGASGGGVF